MPAEAVLITEPSVDFTTFIGIANKALGYSPASAADASHRKLSVAEKFLSCLAALRDKTAPAGIPPNLLSHVSFSVLVIADEADVLDILEASSGMAFVRAATVARGFEIAVITGTLSQWRDACTSGMTPAVESSVRLLFSKIYAQFEKRGLSHVWHYFNKKPTMDGTGFFLEDKRK